MSDATISRKSYLTSNTGDYAGTLTINGVEYSKVNDLRYGTNPHQTAAYYKPVGSACAVADMEVLKTGKSGLSQTNLEDISYALNICKFFDRPACACMKHINPSGVAVQADDESVAQVYANARDCDPRAAFGSAVAFNVEVDGDTAREIMTSFVECVVAPSFTDEALSVFNDQETYRINKQMRVLKCGDLSTLPRYVGDEAAGRALTFKVLADGSVVIAEPLMTNLRSVDDLKRAAGSNKSVGEQVSTAPVTDQQLADLLAAWYININVRSNGVVLVKNGSAISVGTGEQDRVGAVEQAIAKFNGKYEGSETIQGSVMASDGFFPFPDAVETAAAAGVTAVISPAGSIKDADVVKRANELNVALFHAPERIFSHH
jgi:phosphoribosylaminoimidazolecarboxamide formyltransferase/IMP cyclohydrolase